jgi:hypothetical protein
MFQKKTKVTTGDQRVQALRLLCALQRAITNLKKIPDKEVFDCGITEKDRVGAIIGLKLAKRQLADPTKRQHDLGTSVLLGYLDETEKPRVAKVLKDAMLLKLSHFGHRSWGRIEMAFMDAGVNCPLAFISFHAAYREELQFLQRVPRGAHGSVRLMTTPISLADMA